MTAGYSSIILMGNLGADPEAAMTKTGVRGARFSLAVNHARRDGEGNQRQSTDWFQVTVWGQLAELVKASLTKGSVVLVESTPRVRVWNDKQGNRRRGLQVVAREVILLDGGASSEAVDADEDDWLS